MSTVNIGSSLPAGAAIIGLFKIVDSAGTNVAGVDANHNQQVSINQGANQAGVDASNNLHVGLWNGTNQAGVDSAGNQVVKGNFVEQSGLSASSLNADLVASTDVSAYGWLSLQITGIATGGTISFQASNDNFASQVEPVILSRVSLVATMSTSSTTTGIFEGPCNFRYFRARQTAYSSGSTTGVCEFYTLPKALTTVASSASQVGTWTVQPGNTPNSTPWLVTINNGGNSATVKAANTAPTLADLPLVVAASPANTGLPVNVPSVVQKTSNVSSGSVASLAKAFASNNVAGNSIIVVCAVGNGTAPTVTDTNSNVYTQAAQVANGTAFNTAIFSSVGPATGGGIAGGANTVTVNNGGTTASIAMEIYEVPGLLTLVVAQPEQSATNTGSSGTASTSAITPQTPNVYAFAGIGVGTAAQTITAGSGWTNDSGQQNPTTPAGLFSFVSMSQFLASLKAVTPQATFTSEPWAIVVATFRPVLLGVSGTVALAAGANTIGAVTQASGPWSVNMTQIGTTNVVTGGAAGLLAVGGPVASGATNADNPLKHGGVFNSTQPTVSSGQVVDAQYTARGGQIVATGTDTFNVTLSTGANTVGAVTQASGPWTVNMTQVGGTNVVTGGAAGLMAVGGPVASGASNADNPLKIGAVFNTTQPTVTTGQIVDVQATARGELMVAPGTSGFTVTANAGTNLNTSSLALDTSVNGVLVSQASTTSGQKGPLIQAAVTTASPSYTNAQTDPLSLSLWGSLRVGLSSNNTTVPANTATNKVIKNAPGILCTVVVTTLGTAAITIFDNASTNSGTALLTIPASAPQGTIYQLHGTALVGMTAAGVTNCPALTVYFH